MRIVARQLPLFLLLACRSGPSQSPVTEEPVADLPIAAALTCPHTPKCLGIWDDVVALAGRDFGLPSFEGRRGSLLSPGPMAVWLVVDGAALVPVAELPITDIDALAASFASEGRDVEHVLPGAYRIDGGALLSDGETVLLSPSWETGVAAYDGLRPLVPSESHVLASGWIERDVLPDWVFERLDDLITEMYSRAEAAGDTREQSRLNFLVKMIIESSELRFALREQGEDWIVETSLVPIPGTWLATRAHDNADPRCRLPALLDDELDFRMSACERDWAEPGALEEVQPALEQQFGPLAPVFLGFYDPTFVIEMATGFGVPFPRGFFALRMPTAVAARDLVSTMYLTATAGTWPSIVAVAVDADGDDVTWRFTWTDKGNETHPVEVTVTEDVLLMAFGAGADQRRRALLERLASLQPVTTGRFVLALSPSTALIETVPPSSRPMLEKLRVELRVTSRDGLHVASLRLHKDLLRTLAGLSRDEATDVQAAPADAIGEIGF